MITKIVRVALMALLVCSTTFLMALEKKTKDKMVLFNEHDS